MNITFLGLMRRAGALEPGQDRALAAVGNGSAKLLILPKDAPERVKRNAQFAVEGRKNPKIVSVDWTNAEISEAIGIGGCTILAVTDKGFAEAFLKKLGGNL